MTLPFVVLLAVMPFDWAPIGPERGSVTAIALGFPELAGTAQGRVFQRTSGSWVPAADHDAPIRDIRMAGSDQWVHAGGNLYRSGRHVASEVTGFAIAPSNENLVYASTAGAILVSVDRGATFQSRPGGALSIAVDAGDASTVWVVRANGAVEKSIDGGATWTRAAIAEPIRRIEAHPRRPSVAYAIGDDGVGLRTTDGMTWTKVYYLTGRLYFEPDDDRAFYAVDDAGRLFHSDDDGDWLGVVHGGPLLSLAIDGDGSLVAGFREQGVLRSRDGGNTWEAERSGLVAAEIHTLAASPDGNVVYAGSVNSMFRSTNGGATWEPVFTLRLLPGPFRTISIDPANPDRVWIGAGVSLWYTGDGGVHFNRLFWLPEKEPQSVTATAFDPADSRSILILMSQGFFRLDSEPLHLTDLTPPHEPTDRFDVLAVSATAGIWIGGQRNGAALLFHSMDGGRTWTDLSARVGGAAMTALHLDRRLNALVAGTADGSLLRSGDRGITWQRSVQKLPGAVTSLATDGSLLFAAANGVYASHDGLGWTLVSGSLRAEPVTALSSSAPVFAGTAGAGVFVQRAASPRSRAVRR
ncbi:MAG TPA: YCF48-related protein [Thermoanaerobaculia bacterium]|nr:YCF48-related protein [Thermoanaerobaculia bacterium]